MAKPEADTQVVTDVTGTEGQGEEPVHNEETTQESPEVADLRDVLIFTATINEVAEEGEQPEVINFTAGEKITGTLSAGDATDVDKPLSDVITISVAFDTTADLTAYQGLQLSDVKIIVYATQLMEGETGSDTGSSIEG